MGGSPSSSYFWASSGEAGAASSAAEEQRQKRRAPQLLAETLQEQRRALRPTLGGAERRQLRKTTSSIQVNPHQPPYVVTLEAIMQKRKQLQPIPKKFIQTADAGSACNDGGNNNSLQASTAVESAAATIVRPHCPDVSPLDSIMERLHYKMTLRRSRVEFN